MSHMFLYTRQHPHLTEYCIWTSPAVKSYSILCHDIVVAKILCVGWISYCTFHSTNSSIALYVPTVNSMLVGVKYQTEIYIHTCNIVVQYYDTEVQVYLCVVDSC